jgi:xanthine/uracil permease
MLKSSYRMRANGMSQRSLKKIIPVSRIQKGFMNILIPILIGVAIGTLTTFILKLMGGEFNF